MDHHLLLTAETLHLHPDVRSGQAINDVFTVKNLATQTYLRVTKADWQVLEQFVEPSKVPDALRRMIENRTCPPLSDFYEVVLKAHREGILHNEAMSVFPPRPIRWFGVGTGWPVKLSLFVNLLAVGLLFMPGWSHSLVPMDLLKGWGVFCVALSLGQMLGAGVVSGGDGKVYRPRLAWLTWTPHLAFDLRDATLGGRPLQMAAILSGFLPPALAVAAVIVAMPAWSLPVIVAWLWLVRPVFGGRMVQVLELALSRLRPDTKRDYMFEPNRGLYARRRAAVRSTPPAVAAAALLYGVAWVAVVVGFAMNSFGLLPAPWLFDHAFWRDAGLVFAGWVAAVVLLLMLLEVAWWFWRRLKTVRAHLRLAWRRRCFALSVPLTNKGLVAVLLQSPLYRHLTAEQQLDVAQRLKVRTVPAGTTLFDFDENPGVVGLILSGAVRVQRRGPTGHKEKAVSLVEYEVFGAHRVADPKRRVRARSRTRLTFLALSVPAFHELVVGRLGVQSVEQAAMRHPFLRRLSLCAHWHPQALARFVLLTKELVCKEGDLILRKGEDTQELYIVQEGLVEVVLGKHRRRVLRPGAFFGEIGLLQNSRVVADVRARTAARCLAINKRDFLRFMTHNPSVGLQVERISSERLGRPVFPLSRESFDIR